MKNLANARASLARLKSDYATLAGMTYPRNERAARFIEAASDWLAETGFQTGSFRLESIETRKGYTVKYSLVHNGERVFGAQGSPLDCASAMAARLPSGFPWN